MSPRRPPRPPSPPRSTASGRSAAPSRSTAASRRDPAPTAPTEEGRAPVALRRPPSETKGTAVEQAAPRGVVQAADRFRALMRPRPWLRHRRTIIASLSGVVVLVLAAVAVLLFVPTFQVADVEVAGTGYVDPAAVRSAADPAVGGSILTVPTGDITAAVETIPGVRSAEVDRHWPRGVRVTVTEREPIAVVTGTDGATTVVDAEGVELPAEAAEGESLAALTVEPNASDPPGSIDAMIEVLGTMPAELRASVTGMSAAAPSDVSFTIGLEDGGTKTVVWGDARDAELKAEVVQALLGEPGSVIDVSSPVAPVTR